MRHYLRVAMNNLRHYLSAVAALLIWGFLPWLLKALSAYSSGEILYFRILFACALLLVIVFGFRRAVLKKDITFLRGLAPAERRRIIITMLSGGALLTGNWLIFIYTVNNIN